MSNTTSDRVSDMIIFETQDYAKFKALKGNRAVRPERTDGIIASIKKIGLRPAPIIVNENYEVIDGQGRLSACKELGLPVLYVIDRGAGVTECIAMNQKMRNWTLYDFIDSFAQQGRRDYVRLLEISKEAPELSKIDTALCLSDVASRNIDKSLREGTYRLMETDETVGCLMFIREAVGYLKNIKASQDNTKYYLPVLVGLYKFTLIDEARMLESLKANSNTMKPAYTFDSALTELQSVYNYRRRKSEYFRDAYLAKMESKGARYKNH